MRLRSSGSSGLLRQPALRTAVFRLGRATLPAAAVLVVAGLVPGIIFAFGVKTSLAHVDAHLPLVAATALCGGVVLYLVAVTAFQRRSLGSLSYPRLIAAAILITLVPAATVVPAIAALGLVSGVTSMLIAYETWRYAEVRDRIRHPSRARTL